MFQRGKVAAVPAELLVLAAAGGLTVASLITPSGIEDGPVVCPIRLLTGIECPGCGLTRAWVYAAHGDLAASWGANPFGLVLILAALVLTVVAALYRVRHRRSLDIGALRPVLLAGGALWLAWGIARAVT